MFHLGAGLLPEHLRERKGFRLGAAHLQRYIARIRYSGAKPMPLSNQATRGSAVEMPSEGLQKLKDGVGVFHGFTDDELVTVLRRVTQRMNLGHGEVIFREGGPGNVMYIILSGKVRITRQLGLLRAEELAVLEYGDCFGEMGLIDTAPRSARAIAEGETVILGLRESALSAFDPSLAYKLYRNFASVMAARLRCANEVVARLTAGRRELHDKFQVLTTRLGCTTTGLRATDLSASDLSGVELREADLRGATLHGARFERADLKGVDLRGAQLNGAWFVDVDLRQADFSGADLRGATFRGTNFAGSTLAGAKRAEIRVTDELGEYPVARPTDE